MWVRDIGSSVEFRGRTKRPAVDGLVRVPPVPAHEQPEPLDSPDCPRRGTPALPA